MYQIGDLVVYGCQGVCRIVATEERSTERKNITYYVLVPVDQTGATYRIPTENPAALAKLRPIISREKIDALLQDEQVRKLCWISDENQRKQRYRELISSGDYKALLMMIHAIHQHKESQMEAGRKLHMADENFLRDAQRLLAGEFSVALGIAPEQVGTYILSALNEN